MSNSCGTNRVVKIYSVQPSKDDGLNVYQDGNFILSGVTNLNFLNSSVTQIGDNWVDVSFTGTTSLNISGDLIVSGNTVLNTVTVNTLSGGTFYGTIFSGGTFYGDGSQLTGIVTTDNYVTGATFNSDSNLLTLTRSGGLLDITETINITKVNNLIVNGNLSVTGDTTINNLTVNNLTVTGSTTIDDITINNLTVTGNTTFNQVNATIFSGGTYYGDGSKLSGITTTDNYTTGATLNGNTLIFNRTDSLSAYTVDLSGLVVTGVTSNISSDTPPSLEFSGSTWIRSTDYESFIYDVNRGKWLSVNTNQFEGSRSRTNQTDVFLRTTDGSPYNLSPYYMSKNITIINVVGESSVTGNSFNILLTTGTTISSDTIYTLNVSGLVTDDTNTNVDVSLGTNLYLYMSGNSIDYPKTTVYYKYR